MWVNCVSTFNGGIWRGRNEGVDSILKVSEGASVSYNKKAPKDNNNYTHHLWLANIYKDKMMLATHQVMLV